MKIRTLLIVVAAVAAGALCFAAGEKVGNRKFTDVPVGHWAAPAVEQLVDHGVLLGYPDNKFDGDKPVTRYELAVALARFAEFIEAGRKPLVPAKKSGAGQKGAKCPKWAQSSVDFLVENQFLPVDSPVISDGAKFTTIEDLAQSLACMSERIIRLEVTDPGPADVP